MSSIIDDTNLPAQVPGILAKRPEDRSQIEQAVLDAYNVKLGPAGAAKVGQVAGLEAKLPANDKRKICAKTGGSDDCKEGMLGIKCAICNPTVKI